MTELIIRYAEPSGIADKTVIPSEVVGELVRCKDCEYYTDGKCYYPHGYHDVAVYSRVNDNDFCSWAKMK